MRACPEWNSGFSNEVLEANTDKECFRYRINIDSFSVQLPESNFIVHQNF